VQHQRVVHPAREPERSTIGNDVWENPTGVDGLDVCGCRALMLHARGRAIVSLKSDWGRQRTLIGIG